MAVVQTLIGNVKGPQGETGATGAQGAKGDAATITVGSVSTTAYGNAARVENVGTENDAILNFTIPQGAPGQRTTTMSGLTLDTVTTSAEEFPVPAVGENGATVWGKVIKFFRDTIAALTSKLDANKVVNSQAVTEAGYALDAQQANPNVSGSLAAQISDLNDSLGNKVGNDQGGANPVRYIQQVSNGDLNVYGDLGTWTLYQTSNNTLRCAIYTFTEQTVAANVHTNLTLTRTISGKIITAFVVGTPNAAYVFANIKSVSSSGVIIGVYNTASSAVTGPLSIAVLYTNA